MTSDVKDKPVESAESAEPTLDEIHANPSLEKDPGIADHVEQAAEEEAFKLNSAGAKTFGSGFGDGNFASMNLDNTSQLFAQAKFGDLTDILPFSSKKLAGPGADAGLRAAGRPVVGADAAFRPSPTDAGTERRLEAPVVAPGTQLSQDQMAAMIRQRNYENPGRTDATINGRVGPDGQRTGGLEQRLLPMKAADGSDVPRSLDQPGDLAREQAQFQANLARMTPEQRARAEQGMAHLNERNMSEAQKAGVYASLNDMMDPRNADQLRQRGINESQLNDSVASAIQNLGNPAFIRQGDNNSCALDAPLKELAATNPAAAADLIRQLHVNSDRQNGNPTVTMPDGRKIEVHGSFAQHDSESRSALTPGGVAQGHRDQFNRSMNLILGNAVSQSQYGAFYVDTGRGTGAGDTGERMVTSLRALDPGNNVRDYQMRYGDSERTRGLGNPNEVINSPIMTAAAGGALNQMLGNGDRAVNGNRVGIAPGTANTTDVRNVSDYDRLLAANGGVATTSLDSRHALFQAYGANAGYGGGHSVFNFGEFNVGGQSVYMMGTWGKLGMVQKGDLVNAMAPRHEHVGVQAGQYDTPAARNNGAWVRQGTAGADNPTAAPGQPGAPQNGENRNGGENRDIKNIQDPHARKLAEEDQRYAEQRNRNEQDRQELEAKAKRTKEDEQRLADIKKRIEEDAKRQKKHYKPAF